MLAAIGIGIATVKGRALDKQSRAYVDAAVPAIVSTWSAKELLDRASPSSTRLLRALTLSDYFEPSAHSANCKSMKARMVRPSPPMI